MIRLLRLELLPPDQPQLLLIDRQWLKETLAAEVVLQDVEQLRGLYFPARTVTVGEDVADGALGGGHARHVSWDTVPYDLAEVAFPLATRAGLRVAKAVRVEGPWAIVATNELTWLLADATLVLVSLGIGFFLATLARITLPIDIIQNGTSSRIKQALLEHVKALHVHLLKDELRVIPRRYVHHVIIGHRDGDRTAWP